MEMVNTKVLLFIALLLSGIAVSVLGIKQHMDAGVQERIEVDRSYDDKMKEDMRRMKDQIKGK